jgi:hypothetical protein
MRGRRGLIAIVLAVASIAVVVFLMTGGSSVSSAPSSTTQESDQDGGSEAEAEGEARGGSAEAEEEAHETAERVEAWQAAKAAGNLRVTQTAAAAPTAGWTGEQVVDPKADDWEPAIAADPNAPFVYTLVTRYSGTTACGNPCPLPYISLRTSTDNGATWGPARFLCECRKVQGQFDPIIEVVPNTGAVYAVWMNDFNVVFAKSTDHGATWSAPVKTYANVAWNDKPVLAVSDNGQNVYVSWNGPNNGDPWVAQSHDGGSTWTQTQIVDGPRYYFAFDADVLPNGTVVFAESSISYTGPGGAAEGQVDYDVIRSTDGGATWQDIVIDTLELGEPCTAVGCTADYYYGHPAVSADANGALVYLHDGALTAGGPQTVWAQISTDGGATWTSRVPLSTSGVNSTFPALESRASGDVRAWYMQADGGKDAWNVWYRSSINGGATWSAPAKISDSTSGAPYKTTTGFKEPYGDYGEAAITNTGKFIGVWGEGKSYTGPGGVWFNRQA